MKFFAYLLFSIFPILLFAQEDKVFVEKIIVKGNKKTKENIVLREINFKQGDSLAVSNLMENLERNRLLVLNSGLFTQAKFNVKKWNEAEKNITLLLEVKEAWYILPFPIFELADRNFNVWWVEQNRDFKRLNLGMRLYYLNLSGRNDLLKFVVQTGYSQKLEVKYALPFINKNQTFGLEGNVMLSRNKEVQYATEENKQQFYRTEDDNFLLKRMRFGLGLSYRPKQLTRFTLGINFHDNFIDDFVAEELNPYYFLKGRKEQKFFSTFIKFSYDLRDIKPFPHKGSYFEISFQKDGFDIFQDRNTLFACILYAKYFSFTKKLSFESIVKGGVSLLRDKQDYYNYRAFGYLQDFIRGYEYYVIDGADYAYYKSSLRWKLLERNINFGRYMPISAFRDMPLKIYFSINADIGYVNDPFYSENNKLVNIPLYGGGIGLNFVAFYSKVIQLEYSMNHLKEKALFLHYKISF